MARNSSLENNPRVRFQFPSWIRNFVKDRGALYLSRVWFSIRFEIRRIERRAYTETFPSPLSPPLFLPQVKLHGQTSGFLKLRCANVDQRWSFSRRNSAQRGGERGERWGMTKRYSLFQMFNHLFAHLIDAAIIFIWVWVF